MLPYNVRPQEQPVLKLPGWHYRVDRHADDSGAPESPTDSALDCVCESYVPWFDRVAVLVREHARDLPSDALDGHHSSDLVSLRAHILRARVLDEDDRFPSYLHLRVWAQGGDELPYRVRIILALPEDEYSALAQPGTPPSVPVNQISPRPSSPSSFSAIA